MKTIFFSADAPGYPVGGNISGAILSAKKAAQRFNRIKEFKGYRVNIWCRGSSGAILASLFASHLNVESTICHVKKDGEKSHCSGINPYFFKFVNVIIDDFVETGSTVNAIFDKMIKYQKSSVHCLIVHECFFVDANNIQQIIDFTPEYLLINKPL